MLMALLYCDQDRIAAAAAACDQMPYGETYWTEYFAGDIEEGPEFETAYMFVNDLSLQKRLLMLGIDEKICGRELAEEIAGRLTPEYLHGRAA